MSEKRRFLAENGYYVTTPSGNSMRPFIRGGRDVVTVLPPTRALRKYDAVFYERESGEHVIHRIVGQRADRYLLRGDNCYYTESLPKEQVIGLVERVIRGEREIVVDAHGGYRLAVRLWCAVYPLRYLANLLRSGGRWLWRKSFGRRIGNEKKA